MLQWQSKCDIINKNDFGGKEMRQLSKGEALQRVLKNVGVCFEIEDALEFAMLERLCEKFDASETATQGFFRKLIAKCYDIDIEDNDTALLTEENMEGILLEFSEEMIEKAYFEPTNKFRIHPMEHEITEDNSNVDPFLVDTGAGGGVINSPWKDGWNQNEENLEKLRDTAQKFKERNLKCWLYDEVVYPSGWANGYIDTPENRFTGRNIGISIFKGTDEITLPANAIKPLKAYACPYNQGEIMLDKKEEIEITEKANKGEDWAILVFYIRYGNIWPYKWATKLDPPIGPRKLLNFLDHDAVEKFLEGAIDTVSDKLGRLGDYFQAAFTDEPTLQSMYQVGEKHVFSYESVPYSEELFPYFYSKFGYKLEEKLPYLFFGKTEEAMRTRVNYYTAVGDLIAKNFTGQYREKCHSNGIKFSGHLLGEETLYEHVGNYGNYMQAIGQMDIPGCDVCEALNRRFWWRGKNGAVSVLYTASQAKLSGHNNTMVEVCPVFGQPEFLQNVSDNFLKIVTSCVFTGATYINMYAYRFVSGTEKFNFMNEYTGRLCLLAQTAKNDAKIGVYYPIEDIEANMYEPTPEMYELSEEVRRLDAYCQSLYYYLQANLLDFNVITAPYIAEGNVENGKLNIGAMDYKAVLVPPVQMISLKAIKKLKEFKDAGGSVFFLERLPEFTDEEGFDKSLINEFECVKMQIENVLWGAEVEASSIDNGYSLCVTNGNDATFTCFEGWSSSALPATLEMTMKEPQSFNHVEIYSTDDHEQSEFTLEYFDGQWKELCHVEDNIYCRADGDFDEVTAQKVRLVFRKGCKSDMNIARLNEVQLYSLKRSDKPFEFTKTLKNIVNDKVTAQYEKPDSLRMRRTLLNGKPCYLAVNVLDETQNVTFSHIDGKTLRLYDLSEGTVSDFNEKLSVNIPAGKAVFVSEK